MNYINGKIGVGVLIHARDFDFSNIPESYCLVVHYDICDTRSSDPIIPKNAIYSSGRDILESLKTF